MIDKYPIQSDCKTWTIAKAMIDGCTMYSLHRMGEQDALKYSEDVEDCKAVAENHGK